MRLEIYREAKAWGFMEIAGRELLRRMPEHPKTWIDAAIAVRRTESVKVARELLEQAEVMFPDSATIQFKLGCYSCLLGDIEEKWSVPRFDDFLSSTSFK